MNLSDRAIRDFKRFTSDAANGFGIQITLEAPNGETAIVNGFSTAHHYSLVFDEQGKAIEVNSKKASVAFSEGALLEVNPNYPIRTNGEVTFKNHKVDYVDSTGTVQTYVALQYFPDEKIGCIVLILGGRED
jgi:hypothetical protein